MITEKDLVEAIAECQGDRNPNANTCIKLAAYYTILNEMNKSAPEPTYSYAAGPVDDRIHFEGDTEFAKIINGRYPEEVLSVMDELMTALQVVNPRMYAGVLRKFEGG